MPPGSPVLKTRDASQKASLGQSIWQPEALHADHTMQRSFTSLLPPGDQKGRAARRSRFSAPGPGDRTGFRGRYSLGHREHQRFLQDREGQLLPKAGGGTRAMHKGWGAWGPFKSKVHPRGLTRDGRFSPCCFQPAFLGPPLNAGLPPTPLPAVAPRDRAHSQRLCS